MSATTAGSVLGIAFDKMLYESFGFGGWLLWGSLFAAVVAAPVLCASALMSGRGLPTFLELIGPRQSRTYSFPTILLGFVLIVTTVIAGETALGSIFDARWRDLPFAALTMAVLPFSTLSLLNRPTSGTRPIAEAVFAGLFAGAAIYIILIEGTQNWQAVWTSAAYLLFGITLWRARSKQDASFRSISDPEPISTYMSSPPGLSDYLDGADRNVLSV
jgi:glucan 1,3-beta-glucosidase